MTHAVMHDTPLTHVDAVWLLMDDPTNLMTVTAVFLFDAPLSVERLRDTLVARVVERFPRMRHKVERRGFSAVWVKDPTFDIDAHIHRRALPAPGGEVALREVVSDLLAAPLDPSKPLWQCDILEGLGSGCALVVRLHQCIGDGIALIQLLLSTADTTPDAPWPKPAGARRVKEKSPAERIVSLLGDAHDLVQSTLERTRKVTGTLIHESVESLMRPSQVINRALTVTEGASVLMEMLTCPPDPATVFRGALGVPKSAAWSSPLALSEVKAISRSAGGTVNDVLAAAVAGALRRYLVSRGGSADGIELHATSPVNLRGKGHDEAGDLGNRFGLISLGLPVGVPSLPERFRIVKSRMDRIKTSPEPFVGFHILNAIGVAPAEVVDLFVNLFGTKATLVLTNVIGPGKPIYLAGEKVTRMLFWVPQMSRKGLGISFFSYGGEVSLAVASDRGLVPDPENLVSAFEEELRAIAEWARSLPPPGSGDSGPAANSGAGTGKDGSASPAPGKRRIRRGGGSTPPSSSPRPRRGETRGGSERSRGARRGSPA
ncbi:MAG: wax ester/triacylglycerol synthase family O-acyltransferase [Acidobacteria bacterium]|nr:wax ester/triacylglycerol synthase family O-acyltransferase [Acidobacteriota bacterium]MCK6681857.1 wax ester/triacylglycerol synthase family O-acyltransferase [Thermoanaerobaculia bacterium]